MKWKPRTEWAIPNTRRVAVEEAGESAAAFVHLLQTHHFRATKAQGLSLPAADVQASSNEMPAPLALSEIWVGTSSHGYSTSYYRRIYFITHPYKASLHANFLKRRNEDSGGIA